MPAAQLTAVQGDMTDIPLRFMDNPGFARDEDRDERGRELMEAYRARTAGDFEPLRKWKEKYQATEHPDR